MTKDIRWRVYALLVVSMVLWGGTWPVGRVLAGSLTPWNAALLRFVCASVVLVLLCLHSSGWRELRPKWNQLPAFMLLGSSGILGYSYFFFSGLRTTDAGRAALIVGCIPVCIALGSALVDRHRLSPLTVLGIGVSLIGVSILVGDGNPLALLRGDVQRGDLLICGCVLCWTVYTLVARRVMAHVSPLVAVTWSCIFGTLLLLPLALGDGLLGQVMESGWREWSCILYLGVLATSLGYYWYYHAISQVGPVASSVFINLVPLFGLLFGALFLKETVTVVQIAGGALVIGGVVVAAMSSRPG